WYINGPTWGSGELMTISINQPSYRTIAMVREKGDNYTLKREQRAQALYKNVIKALAKKTPMVRWKRNNLITIETSYK
ncbi:unnamed protein product, partial [Ceratitis capitata]